MIRIFLIACVLVFSASANSFGQSKKYQVLDTIQGIEVQFKWANAKWFKLKKDAQKALFLKFRNTNDYRLNVEYAVSFYLNGMRQYDTSADTIDIKAGKRTFPRIQGHGVLLDEELNAEEVTWQFERINVQALKEEE